MTPYTVIIQPEAEADLDDAFEYLEAQKPCSKGSPKPHPTVPRISDLTTIFSD
jgi:hypothetical protein